MFTSDILRNKVIQEWLLNFLEGYPQLLAPKGFPLNIMTTGNDPFNEEELDDFFRRLKITPHPLSSNLETLIIGRTNWEEDDVNILLDNREGLNLKVYSQEMFLSYLLLGTDPFDGGESLLREFGNDHPALEYLSSLGFAWPQLIVSMSGGYREIQLRQQELLSYWGYRVGLQGLPKTSRQRILSEIFCATNLPTVFDRNYLESWGPPLSPKRLEKMANSLAVFCKNAKVRRNPPLEAIADWEDDLRWMERTLYTGRFQFRWPSTYVGR